ncbi:hypothetical protein AeNC1_003751 [Aphanomyces euteiches]|nr:hypothetical protein AeNC1_003751 [Aphanomyces euteiches]
MQVLWIDPTTNEASSVVELSLAADSLKALTVAQVKELVVAELRRMSQPSAIFKRLLLGLLSGRTKEPTTSLHYYGHPLRNQDLIEPYLPTLKTPETLPRFVLRNATPLDIHITTLTGNTFPVVSSPLETVRLLKETIESLQGFPVQQQRLVFAGTELEDDWTLGDYQIPQDATVHLMLRLRGGVEAARLFADVEDEQLLEQHEFASTGSPWRAVDVGLNIHGICTNDACEAKDQHVVAPVKWTPFNLQRHTAKCPMCRLTIEPKTCGFYKCRWRFEGLKLEAHEHVSSPWAIADGEVYHSFNADESKQVAWESLVIIPMPLRVDSDCVFCMDKLADQTKVYGPPCGHLVHRSCVMLWGSYCKANNADVTCPTCRAAIQL